jgi:hypothetical protein
MILCHLQITHEGPFSAARRVIFVEHIVQGVHSPAQEVELLNKNAAALGYDMTYTLASLVEYHAYKLAKAGAEGVQK